MTPYKDRYDELLALVALDREDGDLYKRDGQLADANKAYSKALERVDQFLMAMSEAGWKLGEGEIAELYGIRGGLLRRLERLDEALESYAIGADAEQRAGLASTYNRLNEIRLALLLGGQPLSSLQARLRDAENTLNERLTADQEAADDGWLWADLGDMRLLRGDVDGAEDAYRVFVSKATLDSPEVSLRSLEQVHAALNERQDPATEDVKRAIDQIAPVLKR